MSLPVKIRLIFDNGKTEDKVWSGTDGLYRLSGQGPDRLLAAAIDPEGVYMLDVNRLNNIRTVSFKNRQVLFCSGWLQFWIQNYLNGWAMFS